MGEGCSSNNCYDVTRLEHQIEELKKSNAATHEKLWNEINDLKTNDAVQDSKYDTILNQLNSVVMEVKALQAVPGNNWRDLVKTILTSVATLLVGYALGKIGIL